MAIYTLLNVLEIATMQIANILLLCYCDMEETA